MSRAVALLVLRAHAGIHAGVGQEVGVVDLPIQRERVTNFPVVRGASLKGALRQAAKDGKMTDDELNLVFGPDDRTAPDHAGALSVGDARLLLFPMRSLRGTFAWVTCPFAVRRLRRDLDDAGIRVNGQPLPEPPAPADATDALVAGATSRVAFTRPGQQGAGQGRIVVVEDYGFKVAEPTPRQADPADGLAAALARLAGDEGLSEAELKARLVLLRDDMFQSFVSYCTEVVTRVHLEDETKTVKPGQLWTEELLPAESVLVALLLCVDQRAEKKNGAVRSGRELLEALKSRVGRRLQVGGNETVGYGVCHVSWVGPYDLPGPAKREG